MTQPRANPTLRSYSGKWLELCGGLKSATVDNYERNLRLHILPALGRTRLRAINRGQVKELLAAKRREGLSRGSVQLVLATLRSMLAAAVDDELIEANVALGLGRSMRLQQSRTDRAEGIKAMTGEQLVAFLDAASAAVPAWHGLFWVMSRSGVRLGEGLGLQWDDLDADHRQLRVERSWTRDGLVSTPKSGHGRTVDLSPTAADALPTVVRLSVEHRETTRETTRETPWMFPGADGRPRAHEAAQAAFRRARARAGLREFTPHCLRHTFASILLAAGVPAQYVQQQLGHSSIQLTVDTYGRYLRKKAPAGALDVLEAGA